MELEKHVSLEYPALDVIKDAMKSPNDWEARHTDIGNGEWFTFTDWRYWGMRRLIGAKLRRVHTEPKPSEDAPVSYNEFLRTRASGETWLARPPGGDWHESRYWTTWSPGFNAACEWKRATPAVPTETETLRGTIRALEAALEQEREKRKELERENYRLKLSVADVVKSSADANARVKELEARAARIASTAINFVSLGGSIVHAFESDHMSVCSLPVPRGTYRVLLEKVGE